MKYCTISTFILMVLKVIMVIILVRWRIPNPRLVSLGLCSKIIRMNGSGSPITSTN